MASITVPLSDDVQDWLEEQVLKGGYASAGDYMADLVTQERIAQGEELSLEEVQLLVRTSRASGIGTKTMNELFAEAQRAADTRKPRLA
ncbi:type II toxin-antitoxin system ParD family antitoxin [Aliirhizobium terrae]|uniref:ribbon-helix-helix domain-containing protein n=1 Tax=Terrirhizobium terrae TaxID=2926709 RepID=UPI0025771505|nr:type II toxin-antitoxin system ParD family antitoxin [Rhizobium sp. CC-CFT758]WJH40847.1 type II toxin-antitoxin system ParD family antitoxin [Rhizobium sp. CC-CFT758]